MDHIIPKAVVPELDKVIGNLELMPLRLNEGKNAKIGERQRDLAGKLNKAGLLSEEGLKTVLRKSDGTEQWTRGCTQGKEGRFC